MLKKKGGRGKGGLRESQVRGQGSDFFCIFPLFKGILQYSRERMKKVAIILQKQPLNENSATIKGSNC